MALYKAVIGFDYLGQKMANILYYRDGGNELLVDGVTAQEKLAEEILQNVVLGGVVGQTRLGDILTNECVLDEIRVQRINAVTFAPLTNAPHVENINLVGLSNGDAATPGHVAIMRLICPATTIAPTDYTPKSGYIAIGPLRKDATTTNGLLTADSQTAFGQLSAALVQTLTDSGGFEYKPIRVGRGKNALGNMTNGFNDVQSASINIKTSFRRSRNR